MTGLAIVGGGIAIMFLSPLIGAATALIIGVPVCLVGIVYTWIELS